MSWKEFFKEQLPFWVSYFFFVFLFGIFFLALQLDHAYLFLYFLVFFLFACFWFFYSGYQRKKFYDSFFETLNTLDDKYLIHEMEFDAHFLEARKMFLALYEIDKSMKEKIVALSQKNQGFRDYIELWLHEIKIPIANLVLLIHNKEKEEQKLLEQINRIEEYTTQVLYYVRSEMAEKDYLIQNYSLSKIVSEVVRRNKDAFIYGGVKLDMHRVQGNVLTDEKWLGFILNQILSNSLKYKREKDAQILISSQEIGNQTILKIRDNGIGILEADLPRVFEKSFTGVNGRKVSTSTGMGLYICKGLITKLGHQIQIQSKVNEFTEVTIIFSKTDFYEVVSS